MQVIPLQHNIEIGGKGGGGGGGKQWVIKVKKLSLLNLLLINDRKTSFGQYFFHGCRYPLTPR